MTTNYKLGIVGTRVILAVGLLLVQSVMANPLLFSRNQTATATTTKSYMTPGTATTTLVFDSNAGGDSFASDSATLFLQLTGSTTPSNAAVATTTFKVTFEYAHSILGTDCLTDQTLCDWYSDGIVATTTKLGWQTEKGVLVASTTPTKIFLDVPTPTRYVRANISVANITSNLNGAVWAQFIAQKQRQ